MASSPSVQEIAAAAALAAAGKGAAKRGAAAHPRASEGKMRQVYHHVCQFARRLMPYWLRFDLHGVAREVTPPAAPETVSTESREWICLGTFWIC